MAEPEYDRIRILLISGWAGTGKDTVAALTGYRRIAFADPLKQHVAALSGIPLSVFHSREKDRPLPIRNRIYPDARTPRDILLAHARAARAIDPDVYAREVANEIRDNPGVYHWAISDWRYHREYEFLTEELLESDGYDIIRIRVERPEITPSADPTEHDLEDATFDIRLLNDGSIQDLTRRVREKITRPYGRPATA
jgi:hypothetical protein